MKNNNNSASKVVSGIYSMLIGFGLLWLTFHIKEGGVFHMRLSTLTAEDDSVLFNIQVIASGGASAFFIFLGVNNLFSAFDNKKKGSN